VERGCVEARRAFYSWRSIVGRARDPVNRSDFFMFRNFFLINYYHRADVDGRNHFPLGDAGFPGPLLQAS